MPLRPPVKGDTTSLIRSLAVQYGLDPAAVLSVRDGEGGSANRPNDIGDLAGGGSYGPFQLYAKGALPAHLRGNPRAADQWAWSRPGIQYALGRMVASGARGLKGRAAVDTIIRKFERPFDPDKSVANALARYSQYQGAGGGSAAPQGAAALGGSSRLQTPAVMQSTPMPQAPNLRRQTLLQGLIAGNDIYDTIAKLPQIQEPVAAPLTLSPRPTLNTQLAAPQALRTAPKGRSGQNNSDWQKWLGSIQHRTGPSAPHKPETLQFVAKVAQIAGKPLTPWGNESHSLTTVSGRPSQHGTGDAADIPASGAELIRIGQAALIAAGADPAWAGRQTGGLFNINGRQVIFATNQGGNHFDHLHVGL